MSNSYQLETNTYLHVNDQSDIGVYLFDQNNSQTHISLRAANGVSVSTSGDTITFDGSSLDSRISTLEAGYTGSGVIAALQSTATNLQSQITNLDGSNIVYATAFNALQSTVNGLPTTTAVGLKFDKSGGDISGNINMGANKITGLGAPTDDSDAARKSDVDAVTAYVNGNFITSQNSILTSLRVRNTSTSDPAIDLSENVDYGRSALKFRTKCNALDNTVTFGTNNHPWEYNWEFSDLEDFCWTHDINGKQFSITKDGAVAKNLYIADFSTNTEADGRRTFNTIDVKSKLTSTDNSISTLNTSLTNLQNTVNGLKRIYYGDNAPVGTFVNGDMWFKSDDLRLNVRHGGAWVSPDRVEDTALKTSIYNAVNNSTDYASLKTNLLAALS